MNSKDFDKVVKEQLEMCRGLLTYKAEEYATDTDRLHNFKQAAHLQGTTPRKALMGMLAKHTVSIFDMGMSDSTDFTVDEWSEKISDHINYLLLLKALIYDEADRQTQELVGIKDRKIIHVEKSMVDVSDGGTKEQVTLHFDPTHPLMTHYSVTEDGQVQKNI